jgi:D-3-phosphoglycerate dehydrogenase
MKILVTEELSKEGMEKLRSEAEVDFMKLSREELLKKIKGYDALIVRSQTKVDSELLRAGTRLKVVGRAGVGVDNIDVPFCTGRGILVVNAPEESTLSAAEHTIALMLALARKIPDAHNSLKQGKWERKKFIGTQLWDKTLGIIGLGRVGTEVAKKAAGLGMKVIAYDPYISSERAREIGAKLTSLDELLSESDFISIHTPLTSETKHLLGKKDFEKMRDGVRIINCARGGVIDEKALAEAITSSKVAGAALDVFEKEPPEDSKLLSLENVIVTPHLGASTEEAQRGVAITIADQVLSALRGEPVKNAVNMFTLPPEVFETMKPYLLLAEKLGKFASQLVSGRIESIEISYHGEIAEKETELLSIAVVKGVLERVAQVNYVNATIVAKSRGIKVVKIRTWAIENFTSLLSVKIITSRGEKTVSGTVFGTDDLRIVKINGYRINAVPSGNMLVAMHVDKPKVIGPVGMILGEAGINIAGMQVGRIKTGEEAIMVLNVDSPVSSQLLRKIEKVDGILDAKLVTL